MWFIYALLTAMLTTLETTILKPLSRHWDHFSLAIFVRCCAGAVLLPVLIWKGAPIINPQFWLTLGLALLSVSITSLLMLRALSLSDHSLVIPLTTLSPIILLGSGAIINKELPTMAGVFGVIITIAGVYFLGGNPQGRFWGPLRAIWSESGCRYALLVALIWGIAAPLDKRATLQSSPLFYAFCCHSGTALVLLMMRFTLPMTKQKTLAAGPNKSRNIWPALIAGVINGFSLLCQMLALTTAQVSYVISIKRTSAVFAVVMGYLVFDEKDFKWRLIGSGIAVTGAIIIFLWG